MINTILYNLQVIHNTIPGITAPLLLEDYPPQLRTAQLPIALTIPATSTWNMRTHQGSYDEFRAYRVMVYVGPVAQGKPFEYAAKTIELIETFGAVYFTSYRLLPSVHIDIGNIQDTGLQVMSYGGTDYHGFEYTLNVRSY